MVMIRTVAAASMTALAVAGCAGSGYTYHANRSEQLFFKLPDAWTVFDDEDLGEGEPIPGLWVRGFVAGDEPSTDAVFDVAATEPRGYVAVETLDVKERDEISLSALRGTHFGTDRHGLPVDPLAYAEEHPDEMQVLGYDDTVVYDHGPHGVRIRVAVTPPGVGATGIIDQTVLVDAATSKRYVLSIGCSEECFEEHRSEIEEVIESWTLEET